jgi:hypothetical protein
MGNIVYTKIVTVTSALISFREIRYERHWSHLQPAINTTNTITLRTSEAGITLMPLNID